VSGKWSGVGRKLSERERSGEQACEKTMEREQSEEQEGHGAGTPEWSGEQTKLAAQISLKDDTNQLKLRMSVLPDVRK